MNLLTREISQTQQNEWKENSEHFVHMKTIKEMEEYL